MTSKQEEKTVLDIKRVMDRKKVKKDDQLQQCSGTIALFAGSGVVWPRVIEYTSLAGSWARLCAETSKAAIGPRDLATASWLLSGDELPSVKDTLFTFDPGEDTTGFFQVEEPWVTVLLRDCLWYMKNDAELKVFLKDLSQTIVPSKTNVVFDLAPIETGVTTEENSGVLITQKTEHTRPRVYKQVTKIRTPDEGFVLEEQLTNWTKSDVYACTRETGFKQVNEFGVDTTRFVVYTLKE